MPGLVKSIILNSVSKHFESNLPIDGLLRIQDRRCSGSIGPSSSSIQAYQGSSTHRSSLNCLIHSYSRLCFIARFDQPFIQYDDNATFSFRGDKCTSHCTCCCHSPAITVDVGLKRRGSSALGFYCSATWNKCCGPAEVGVLVVRAKGTESLHA